MKKIHVNTTISFVLSGLSLAIIFYQYKFAPVFFDFRIVSGILGIFAFFAALSEIVKYTSRFQKVGIFIGGIAAGLSLDNFMDTIPFITLSLVLSITAASFRLISRKYLAESEHQWVEPSLMVLSLGCYLSGNILYESKWYLGWILPLPIILMVSRNVFGNIKINKILLTFARKKMGVEKGKPAPFFSLPDLNGKMIKLSDYIGNRYILLIFVRGDWCPSCHMMLRTYQKHNQKFQEKNVMLLCIGPDPVGVNREMASKLGVEFNILSDEGQKTAMDYSVQLPTSLVGEKYSPGIPLPASFLIDKNGIVRYSSSPDKIGEFLNPESIFPILESMN